MGHVFPAGHWPTWTLVDMWAPEIHFVDGKFHVYFAGRNIDSGVMNIGLAISDGPFGPYQDIGQPLINNGNLEVIDITWFMDPITHKTYLSWKKGGSMIVMREVMADGRTFVDGSEEKVIITADLPEDAGCVEGPWYHYR